VGSARTALFTGCTPSPGGTFILRSRTPTGPAPATSGVVGIQDTLRWLGLDWDEGPVLQSARFEEYRAAATSSSSRVAYEWLLHADEVKAARRREGIGRAPG